MLKRARVEVEVVWRPFGSLGAIDACLSTATPVRGTSPSSRSVDFLSVPLVAGGDGPALWPCDHRVSILRGLLIYGGPALGPSVP